MIDMEGYHTICSQLLKLMKMGRGGIYLGGYHILGADAFGHQLITDSRHYPSLKMLYVPPPAEISVIGLMIQLIKRGMVCVDVGAGCGYYSILAAECGGPHGKVYSFEPIPECFELLKKNVRLNEKESITCENKMVLEGSKSIRYPYFGENYRFFFLNAEDQKQKILKIDSLSLDHYFNGKEEMVDFIKINFEKDLPLVLKGMSDLLTFNREIKILCLFNKAKILEGGNDPEELLDSLTLKKFKTFLLPSLDPIEKDELLAYQTTKNILFSRI